jgi:hypothetical protein
VALSEQEAQRIAEEEARLPFDLEQGRCCARDCCGFRRKSMCCCVTLPSTSSPTAGPWACWPQEVRRTLQRLFHGANRRHLRKCPIQYARLCGRGSRSGCVGKCWSAVEILARTGARSARPCWKLPTRPSATGGAELSAAVRAGEWCPAELTTRLKELSPARRRDAVHAAAGRMAGAVFAVTTGAEDIVVGDARSRHRQRRRR